MIGKKMAATTVITLSEYELLAELATVRLNAEFVLDTITLGKSSKKMDATTLPMAVAAAANAQPSAPASASHAPPSTATSASASMGSGTKPELIPTWSHVNQPKVITAASQPSRPDRRATRSCSAPSVLSVR